MMSEPSNPGPVPALASGVAEGGGRSRSAPWAQLLFGVAVLELGLQLLSFAWFRLLVPSLLGRDTPVEQAAATGWSLIWLLHGIALFISQSWFARSRAGTAAATPAWTAVACAGVGVVTSLVWTLSKLAAYSIGAITPLLVLSLMPAALGAVGDIALWTAARRTSRVSEPLTWTYFSLRSLLGAMSLVRIALPWELWRALIPTEVLGGLYAIVQTLLGVICSALILVPLWSMMRWGESSTGVIEPPAQAASSGSAEATGYRDIAIGGAWLIGALAITGASFLVAQGQGGGRFVITTGAVVYGLFRFFRGLARVVSHRTLE